LNRIELATGAREEVLAATENPYARATFTVNGDRFDVSIENGEILIRGRDSMVSVQPHADNLVSVCARKVDR
jgi:hypothetical protein